MNATTRVASKINKNIAQTQRKKPSVAATTTTTTTTMKTQSKHQQQQQHQILSSELFKNSKIHKNHFEILTFLKSNYKYKRRCRCSVTVLPVQATEMQVKQCFDGEGVASTAAAKGNTYCHHHNNTNHTNNTNNNNNNITQEINAKSDKSSFNLINFSFVVLSIVANIIYRKLLLPLHRNKSNSAKSAESLQQIATVTLDGAAPCLDGAAVFNNDVNNGDDNDDDSDETRCQQNYDKLSTLGCQSRSPRRHLATLRQRRATWASMLQQQLRRGSSTSDAPLLPLEIDSHIHVMPIFMTLFIALALSVRCAEGGACWQKTLSNGKCNEIFQLNITKAECCITNQEFSYTEGELSSVEYFFATAIGGGMECAPCLESCKNVNCGPNKKCAKRKGRPKCICAPECGAATRKRKKAKLFRGAQHQKQQQQKHHSDISLRPIQRNLDAAVIFGKSARDIRSLSSEIHSQNIGLDDEAVKRRADMGTSSSWTMTGTGDAGLNRRNSSQRKLIVMQSQARAQSKREHKAHSRLLIVEPQAEVDEEKTTTRRLQVISNVNNNNNQRNNNNRNNANGRKRNRSEKERLHKQEQQQKTTTKESTIQSTSRHKPNGKNKNNSSNNNNNSNNNNLQQTKNFDVNNAKLRHIQQNARQLEDGPNRDQQQKQQQQHQHHGRHHQFRKRKKKLHNQLKDQNAVTAAEIEHEQLAGATTVTMSGWQTKATKTKIPTSTTPANSSSSSSSSATTTDQQRLFKHGSTFVTTSSSSATSLPTLTMVATSPSSASSSSSSSWSPSADAHNRHSQHRIASNSRSFFNSDDLTFDDRIYDKFNLHGFPNSEHKYTQPDRTHSSHHHHHHPVCGTDGRTYNTECQLKKRACRTDNAELTVAYQGHCKTTCNGVKCLNGLTCVEDHYTIPHCIACRTDCPLDDLDDFGAAAGDDDDEIQAQRAVCGVDGKTYRSVCDINRMICKIGRSIGVAYPGPCRDDRVTCSDINCGSKRTCLVDLLTHEPRCVSCRYKCSRKRRPAPARYEEGKLCGANNRTYNSWCEMRKDSCATGFYIDVKKLGVCQ